MVGVRRIAMRYYISSAAPYISDIGSFFDDFFTSGTSSRKFPPVDIYETQEGYAIEAEIASYGDDDIRVSVKDGTLTISSTETLKDRIQKRREARSIISSEIATPQFSRSFSLPEDADRNAIEAESRNGILTIRIPKVVRKDPGRIEIKIGK